MSKTNVCSIGETMVLHPQVVNRITHEHPYRHNTYVTDTYIRLFNATTYIQIKKYHHIKRGQTIDVIMYKRLCYMLNAITAACIVVFIRWYLTCVTTAGERMCCRRI